MSALFTNSPYAFSKFKPADLKQSFFTLLSSVVPDLQIKKPSAPANILKQELVAENNYYKKQDSFTPVISLVEKQVEKKPQQTCLVFGLQHISFFELNQRANQVARYLVQQGVQKNQFVPVCIDRSIEMMIAMLAIFKIGAIYVPLDPAHPADRIEFMLNDLQATHVFATSITRQCLGAHADQVIEIFEKDLSSISQQPAENLQANIEITDIAYVIYTSGSTGRPKGVMVEQGAMYNYMVNSSTKFIHDNNNPFGSYIHLSNTFDASLTSLFMPMLAGKGAVISSTSASEAFNDENFLKYAPYDFLNVTPAHLDFLAATVNDPNNWATQRLVIGGEALYTGHFDFFVENKVPLEIINLYGPTEATIGCTTYTFWLSDLKKQSPEIPIGKPIGETVIYLLQQNGDVLEEAGIGEICIGGLNLALGYLNRTDLTNEKFIANPVKNSPWPRLYKTGDLGKWLPDGNLAYVGRIDNQVKISGYRIELGEIESVINSMHFVNNSCVVASGDSDKKLVCFILPLFDKISEEKNALSFNPDVAFKTGEITDEQNFEWLQNELIAYLLERLPKYMVPSSFVFVKQFPLSSSGKIDRKALLALQSKVIKENTPATRKPNATEKILMETWQTVLSIGNVQVNDNFFEIGGSSVQAARMFNLLRKQFGRQLPISSLINAPTIEQLAKLITKPADKNVGEILVPFRTTGTKHPLFLIHGGAGDVLYYKELADLLPSDQPVYGIIPRGMDGKETPLSSIEKMGAYYLQKIKEIQKQGPYFIVGYCFGSSVAVEMAYQLKSKSEEVGLLACINGLAPAYVQKKAAENPPFYKRISQRVKVVSQNKTAFFPKISREAIFQLKCLKAYLVTLMYWKVLAPLSINLNRPMSAMQTKAYYLWNNDEMLKKHKLKSYKGDMILFRSELFRDMPVLGWDEQIEGKLKVYEIPGEYDDRRQIFTQPYVSKLAEKLKQCLDEVNFARQ